MRTRKLRGAVLASVLAVVALVTVAAAPASAKLSNSFQGNCSGGVCILDEPAGNNPATHGTVTWDGTTLTITPNAGLITEVHVCTRDSAPYVQGPTTCSGKTADRIIDDEGLSQATWSGTPTLLTYWTVHVVVSGRTLQVICGGDCSGGFNG